MAVHAGRAGWLRCRAGACIRFVGWPVVLRRYERLVALICASGRRVVFAVPSGKSNDLPRTVSVYDSCGVGMLASLGSYPRELVSLRWWYISEPDDAIEAIAHADTVILEKG